MVRMLAKPPFKKNSIACFISCVLWYVWAITNGAAMSDKTPNHALSEMGCPASLADVDLFSPGAQEHWYEAYPILHREAPLRKLDEPAPDGVSPVYILSCYKDIETVVKDPERFIPTMTLAMQALDDCIQQGQEPPPDPGRFNVALNSLRTLRPNMELWRSHRQELTDPWVGPGSKRHQSMITEVTDQLIANWIDRGEGNSPGEVEFISEFARPLPQRVMARVLGFPFEDIEQLALWGSAQVMSFVHGKGPLNLLAPEQAAEQGKMLAGFREYVSDAVADKRLHPADDMISFLTQVEYSPLQRKLSDDEINGIVYFMILGGLETTQYALEEQAQLICENPGLLEKLKADRNKIRAFTEEGMRLRSPTQGLTTRITTREENFQGVSVPAGSYLHLRWAAGNVDPRQYDCPYELQLERKSIGNHLAFSQGPRTCPGAGISRLEQTISWNRLLDRLETLEYAPGNDFLHQPGIMLGTLSLKLQFKAAK